MKNIKNKILIPLITGLSSMSLVAPLATISNNANTSVLNSNVNSITYSYINYNTDKSDEGEQLVWSVTLEGTKQARVRQGRKFASAQKPTAVHSLGWKFIGWSKVRGSAADIISDDYPVSSDLNLYPIFENATVVIKEGGETVKSSTKYTYEAEVFSGKTTSNVTWSLSDDWATKGTGTAPTIDSSSGELTTSWDTVGTTTITAEDTISGMSATKTITIEAPYTNSNKVWYVDATPNKDHIWYSLDNDDLCNGADSATTIARKDINDEDVDPLDKATLGCPGAMAPAGTIFKLYIGDQVSSTDENFLIGNNTITETTKRWDYCWTSVNFPSTSKCTYIGKCFMQDCATWNKALTLPASLRVIDDGFLYGCSSFNNGLAGEVSTFTIPSNIVNIGSYFMFECKAFNQNINIPASVTHVGEHFMADCDAFCSTLTVNTAAENFDVFGDISYTLTTSDEEAAVYKTGAIIGGDCAISFIKKFPNRYKGAVQSAYRNLNQAPVDFDSCSWEEIIYWAEEVEAGHKSVDQLCTHFKKSSTSGFVGVERPVTINGQVHKVRVLEVQHPEDLIVEDGVATTTKATFTFELVNLLSDSTGKYMRTSWDNSNNNDLATSLYVKNLSGDDDSATWASSSTEKRTAYQMLTDTSTGTPLLSGHIKTIQRNYKKYNTTSTAWEDAQYNTTLFPMSYYEITGATTTGAEQEGSQYAYWKTHSLSQYGRKYYTSGGNNDYTHYLIGSPYTSGLNGAWYVISSPSGYFTPSWGTTGVGSNSYSLYFAFCI